MFKIFQDILKHLQAKTVTTEDVFQELHFPENRLTFQFLALPS